MSELIPTVFCCALMEEEFQEDQSVRIIFHDGSSYGLIGRSKPYRDCIYVIGFCPWCGTKLPTFREVGHTFLRPLP
jgi:hypothetical protein